MRSCPILKCSRERCVCAPQSTCAGTSTSPRLSVSFRILDNVTVSKVIILSFLHNFRTCCESRERSIRSAPPDIASKQSAGVTHPRKASVIPKHFQTGNKRHRRRKRCCPPLEQIRSQH